MRPQGGMPGVGMGMGMGMGMAKPPPGLPMPGSMGHRGNQSPSDASTVEQLMRDPAAITVSHSDVSCTHA